MQIASHVSVGTIDCPNRIIMDPSALWFVDAKLGTLRNGVGVLWPAAARDFLVPK